MKVKIRMDSYDYNAINILCQLGFRQPSGRDVYDNNRYPVGILIDAEEKIAKFLNFEKAFEYHKVKEITKETFANAYMSHIRDTLKTGSKVIVKDNGRTYSSYDTWEGLKGYENLFKRNESPMNGNIYTILNVDLHENGNDILCLIKDSERNRVYIINELGLEIATEN